MNHSKLRSLPVTWASGSHSVESPRRLAPEKCHQPLGWRGGLRGSPCQLQLRVHVLLEQQPHPSD